MSHQHTHLNARRWQATRRVVFDRDCWRCVQCGRAGRLECDHIVPLEKGGAPLDPDNLQTLCKDCHIRKTSEENRKPLTPAQAEWRAMVEELVKRNP